MLKRSKNAPTTTRGLGGHQYTPRMGTVSWPWGPHAAGYQSKFLWYATLWRHPWSYPTLCSIRRSVAGAHAKIKGWGQACSNIAAGVQHCVKDRRTHERDKQVASGRAGRESKDAGARTRSSHSKGGLALDVKPLCREPVVKQIRYRLCAASTDD